MAIHDWNYGGKKNGTSSGNYSRDSKSNTSSDPSCNSEFKNTTSGSSGSSKQYNSYDSYDDAMDEFDGDW